jgi:hypothetical protein
MYTVSICGRKFTVETLRAAVAAWENFRDEAGLGASDMDGPILVRKGNRTIARMSYNGRLWIGADWSVPVSPDMREGGEQ